MKQVTIYSTVADTMATIDSKQYFAGFDLVPIENMIHYNEHVIRYNGLDPRTSSDNDDRNEEYTGKHSIRVPNRILWWRSPWYTRKY